MTAPSFAKSGARLFK